MQINKDLTPFTTDSDLKNKLNDSDVSILVKEQFTILQDKNYPPVKAELETDDVEIIGRKCSCSSVWCPCCYVKKGGSERFAKRLSALNYKATRQIILTVDPKSFNRSGEEAYTEIKARESISQFVHNLQRTSKVQIKDWVWVLEWHKNGMPHWHVFIETKEGKAGMIGNKTLLKHWNYGLVMESYIKSQKHWDKFTKYFKENGYFNPKSCVTIKDKSHQLELPVWAKEATYQIRKTGSKNINNVNKCKHIEQINAEDIEQEKKPSRTRQTGRKYKEILDTCGQTTSCFIRRGRGNSFNVILDIPYKDFIKKAGTYITGFGFVLTTTLDNFFNEFIPFTNENIPIAAVTAA